MKNVRIFKNEAFTPIGGVGTGLLGNFGYGGQKQLVKPENNPPKDFQHIVDDMVRDQIDLIMNGTGEPIWTSENLTERDLGDAASGNPLPGGPPPNTLVQKKYFVPVDTAEENNVDFLGPTVGGVPLNDIDGNISKNRKIAVPRRMEKQTIDMDTLVNKQQLVPDPDEVRIDTPLDTPLGGMGTLVKGIQNVPIGKGINIKNLENEQKKDFRDKILITPMPHNSSMQLKEMIELLVEQEIGFFSEITYGRVAMNPISQETVDAMNKDRAAGFSPDQISKKYSEKIKAETAPSTFEKNVPGVSATTPKLDVKTRDSNPELKDTMSAITEPLRTTPTPVDLSKPNRNNPARTQLLQIPKSNWRDDFLKGMNISQNKGRNGGAWQAAGVHAESKKKI